MFKFNGLGLAFIITLVNNVEINILVTMNTITLGHMNTICKLLLAH